MHFRVSVRELADFNFPSDSLAGGVLTSTRAQKGIKEHKKRQTDRGDQYYPEVSLETLVEDRDIELKVYGRADGIDLSGEYPVIEEFKTVTSNTIPEKYLAQLKIYGYLYLIKMKLDGKDIDRIILKLILIDIVSNTETTEIFDLTYRVLKDYFTSLIDPYMDYLYSKLSWGKKRDNFLREVKFPFGDFRPGQREFAAEVYRAIRDDNTLFAVAPTGTGKSIATLFPALKAMGEGKTEKIFYLTAKTIGRVVARDAVNQIKGDSKSIRSLIITAKEKSCINNEYNCSPDKCIYSKDYYKKLNPAISEILKCSDFYEDNLKSYGEKYKICPFELSLDLSLDCDVIICDYNYVFDLRVYLKRYFDSGKQNYTLLIDETHNLPSRLRESYSVNIDREELSLVKSFLTKGKVYTSLTKLEKILLEYKDKVTGEYREYKEVPEDLVKVLRKFTKECEEGVINEDFQGKNFFLELYYKLLYFIKLSELYSSGHTFLIYNRGGNGVTVRILCNSPHEIFTKLLLKSSSHIFFSATLSPVEYFTRTLLDNREFKYIQIPSPFYPYMLDVVVRGDIKTTYNERNRYYQEIGETIIAAYKKRRCNTLVFFSSYGFMEEVASLIDIPIHKQTNSMSEEERILFLDKFDKESEVLGFAVLGGLFSEGVDLVGDSLGGVIVVGVGLPGVSIENNLIKEFYDFNYAYTYPGINKVLQAVGRVIRREEDRGYALLLDERFTRPLYRNNFPKEWGRVEITNNLESMLRLLQP